MYKVENGLKAVLHFFLIALDNDVYIVYNVYIQ